MFFAYDDTATSVLYQFMYFGDIYFGGLYKYVSGVYTVAPTQLTLDNMNQLLPGKIGYGSQGLVVGDGSIYNNLDRQLVNSALGLSIKLNNRLPQTNDSQLPQMKLASIVESQTSATKTCPITSISRAFNTSDITTFVKSVYPDCYASLDNVSRAYTLNDDKYLQFACFNTFVNDLYVYQLYIVVVDNITRTMSCERISNNTTVKFSYLGGTPLCYHDGYMYVLLQSTSERKIGAVKIDVNDGSLINYKEFATGLSASVSSTDVFIYKNRLIGIGYIGSYFVLTSVSLEFDDYKFSQLNFPNAPTFFTGDATTQGDYVYIEGYYVRNGVSGQHDSAVIKYDVAANTLTHILFEFTNSKQYVSSYYESMLFSDGTYIYYRMEASVIKKLDENLNVVETISDSNRSSLLSNIYFSDFDITDYRNYTCKFAKRTSTIANGVRTDTAWDGPLSDLPKLGGTSNLYYEHQGESSLNRVMNSERYLDGYKVVVMMSEPINFELSEGMVANAIEIIQKTEDDEFDCIHYANNIHEGTLLPFEVKEAIATANEILGEEV